MTALTPSEQLSSLIRMVRYSQADVRSYAAKYGEFHAITVRAEGYTAGLTGALLTLTEGRTTVALPA